MSHRGRNPKIYYYINCLKKNLNASRPSEHPPVRGENVKTFRWDHRLRRPNLSMAFKQVPRWYCSGSPSA